ncbi:MAG: hypothetical protein HY319_29030 [Armatimonadetes bacterium]|nr:hypothetical protein [Armatimonadota bacterium]
MQKVRILLLIFVVGAVAVAAQSWSVFVNNRPFKGQVAGRPADLLLEVEAVVQGTDAGLHWDGARLTAGENEIPTLQEHGVWMVQGKALAEKLGGRYVVNAGLQSVDIYLFDAPGRSGEAEGALAAPGHRFTFKRLQRAGGIYAKPLEAGKIPDAVQDAAEIHASRIIDAVLNKQVGALQNLLDEGREDVEKILKKPGPARFRSAQICWEGEGSRAVRRARSLT